MAPAPPATEFTGLVSNHGYLINKTTGGILALLVAVLTFSALTMLDARMGAEIRSVHHMAGVPGAKGHPVFGFLPAIIPSLGFLLVPVLVIFVYGIFLKVGPKGSAAGIK